MQVKVIFADNVHVHILQFQTNHNFVRFMIKTDTKDTQDIPTWFKVDVKEVSLNWYIVLMCLLTCALHKSKVPAYFIVNMYIVSKVLHIQFIQSMKRLLKDISTKYQCSSSGTRRGNLVKNVIISHER